MASYVLGMNLAPSAIRLGVFLGVLKNSIQTKSNIYKDLGWLCVSLRRQRI